MNTIIQNTDPHKIKVFVSEYARCLDMRLAAKAANITLKIAKVLLSEQSIKNAISDCIASKMQRAEVTSAFILRELYDQQQADPADIIEANGSVKKIHDWPPIWRRMLSSFDVSEDKEGGKYLTKLRFVDKLKVLEILGKHVAVSAFSEHVKIDVSDSLADRILSARKRAENIEK